MKTDTGTAAQRGSFFSSLDLNSKYSGEMFLLAQKTSLGLVSRSYPMINDKGSGSYCTLYRGVLCYSKGDHSE